MAGPEALLWEAGPDAWWRTILAASLAETGVVVLDVGPGLVRTAMTNAMPMWADTPDEACTPVERVALVAAIAHGRLDRLTGRFIHADDDWELLARRADEINAADGRALLLGRRRRGSGLVGPARWPGPLPLGGLLGLALLRLAFLAGCRCR